MVKYSICSTHYNMRDTIEKSLESILSQIDERYEIIIVDAGSDDGSLEFLRSVEENTDKLRLFVKRGCKRGEGRNIAINKAEGRYVLDRIDLDDYFYPQIIDDFVKIFHKLEDSVGFDFYFSGNGLNMCEKKLLEKVDGYRNLSVAEDKDLRRRIAAEDNYRIIPIKSRSRLCKQLKTKSLPEKLKRAYEMKYNELKSGLKIKNYVIRLFRNISLTLPLHVLLLFLAKFQITTLNEEIYDTPEVPNKRKALSLSELERKYSFNLKRKKLSKAGKSKFE